MKDEQLIIEQRMAILLAWFIAIIIGWPVILGILYEESDRWQNAPDSDLAEGVSVVFFTLIEFAWLVFLSIIMIKALPTGG